MSLNQPLLLSSALVHQVIGPGNSEPGEMLVFDQI